MSLDSDDPFQRRRDRQAGDLDFTSLIDCVFLLLIFFMYSTAMKSQADVDTPEARHGVGVDPETSTIVTLLSVDIQGGSPRYTLGDAGAPQGGLADVKKHIQDGVAQGKRTVIIKAERQVPHKFVMDVARLVGEIPGEELAIAVQEAN